MISIVLYKRCVFSISVFSIIIYKFSYKLKLCLVILPKIDKNLEIKFYYTVLIFNLFVSSRVKQKKKLLLNLKKNSKIMIIVLK